MRALQRVGNAEHALKRGSELSGGQQQRAAIARTLVQGADVLLADEPIASLDPNSARRVMDIISDLNEREGITVVISLHQVEYALRYCPRIVTFRTAALPVTGRLKRSRRLSLAELYGTEGTSRFSRVSRKPRPPAVRRSTRSRYRTSPAMNGGAVRARDDVAVAGHA